MPELPEVEVVRRGLQRWVVGASIGEVVVLHPRPVRRHLAGAEDFAARLRGARVREAVRRGKFVWLVLDGLAQDGVYTGGEAALLAHLGMSGQLLMQPPSAPDERHLRVRIALDGGPARREGRELRFVDQRMFGGVALTELTGTGDGMPPRRLPLPVAHIARDLLDEHLDLAALVARIRTRRSGIKRVMLDQRVVSGIGNIYADEALWRARLHYDRPADSLSPTAVRALLGHAAEVMRSALAQGGTSFDALYVNVNGESGYFERELAVYGRDGLSCRRCGGVVRREPFMNRSSFLCPRCQRFRHRTTVA